MKRIALFLLAALCWVSLAEGQNSGSTGRFEWVRGYAPGEHVSIIGSVTDSLGNLYILGSFNFESRWENGELIMPITPHNGAQNGVNTLIAKISPEGEMVWKKVIHGNAYLSQPHDIKALGDTAFACLVTMPLATDYNWYLYYLDTLVEPNWDPKPDYPMSAEGVDYRCLALITFDFDGNVLEQHFLQMSYLDRYGEDVYYVSGGANDFLSTNIPAYPSFDIDDDGNVYLCRYVSDKIFRGPGRFCNLMDGDISAVRFWCDRRPIGTIPIDSTNYGNHQLLKFSSHLDTLLKNMNLFQSITVPCHTEKEIRVDKNGYIFFTGTFDGSNSSFFVVDSIRCLSIIKNHANNYKGFLVRFDSSLTAKNVISLEDSIIPSNYPISNTSFQNITFDYDSNLMFLCASTGRGSFSDTISFYSILTYQGIPLTRLKNDAFVMSFHLNDSLRLHSYGRVKAKMGSDLTPSALCEKNKIVCQNNRVIIQTIGVGGFRFPNHTINFSRWSDKGLGFVIFDYQGNIIGGDSYSAISPSNRLGPIAIKDSLLYLISRLSSDATFGDIQVPSRGDYFACIAKYVDPAFMTPYVAPTPGPGPEGISDADTLAINSYPNPVRDMLHIAIDDMVIHATAISLTGVRRQVPAKGNTLDLEALQPGIYILEIVTMSHKYHHKIIKL